jgi:hypothetical protein
VPVALLVPDPLPLLAPVLDALLLPLLPPSAHSEAPMSGPAPSKPKKLITALASIGVV